MGLYRKYCVRIQEKDRDKANSIIKMHWNRGDIDDVSRTRQENHDGGVIITYWIRPYVYEDFESIVEEFKEAGIQVI